MKLEYNLSYNSETKELKFQILEQDERIELGNFEYVASNGYRIISSGYPHIRKNSFSKIIYIQGVNLAINTTTNSTNLLRTIDYLQIKQALEEFKLHEPVNKPLIFAI